MNPESPHLPVQRDPSAWYVDAQERLCDEHGCMLDARTAADRYNATRSFLSSQIMKLQESEI